MDLKSYNWLYLAVSLPLIALDAIALIALSGGRIWLVAIICAALVYLYVTLVRKFSQMPHRLEEYGELVPYAPDLPFAVNAEFYLSEEMARHDFMGRTVEIVSSLRQGNAPLKVMVNPEMKRKFGPGFTSIAISREVLKNKQAVNIKNYAAFVAIITMAIAVIAGYFLFRTQLAAHLSQFVLSFVLPVGIPFSAVLLLFLWNKGISRKDYRLDQELLRYFRLGEVEDFIVKMDGFEGKGDSDKARSFNDYFSKERIRKLHSASNGKYRR